MTSLLNFDRESMSHVQESRAIDVSFDGEGIKNKLLDLDRTCYLVRVENEIGITHDREILNLDRDYPETTQLLMTLPPIWPENLGDRNFCTAYGVKYPYYAGAMAGGIASEELVIALGKEKILACFGSGGLKLDRIETAIQKIQQVIPEGPYAFNLLHNPGDPQLEQKTVNLYLKYGVRTVEASAFLDLTPAIVYYRAAGLSLDRNDEIEISNKIIAKVSRKEVASKFIQPAPLKILKQLVDRGLISELQASLAQEVPMADDITVEADSGGHTDNRPLTCIFPGIVNLRDKIQQKYNYNTAVRIGVAGGIGTPEATLAAFTIGAAYIVTGSVNQSCLEAGTSDYTKELLAKAEMTDVMMAPAADMFEMGVKLQVLKKGTMFPVRAQKLYDLYRNYDSIEAIPVNEREKIEKQIFRKNLDEVWQDLVKRYENKDPQRLISAQKDPKRKMSMMFRWYLGLSSRWSSSGETGREVDYQIWCGPAMGSFNDWVKGSYLEAPENRSVIDVAYHLIAGAAYLSRIQSMRMQGLQVPSAYSKYVPNPQI